MKARMATALRHNPFSVVLLITSGTIAASAFITLAVSALIFLLGSWIDGRTNMVVPFLFQTQQIFLGFLGIGTAPGIAHGSILAPSYTGMTEHVISILRNATLTGLVVGVAVNLKKR